MNNPERKPLPKANKENSARQNTREKFQIKIITLVAVGLIILDGGLLVAMSPGDKKEQTQAGDVSPAGPVAAAQSMLGINLGGICDWNSELPFVDLMKMCRPWISQQEGKPWGKGPELEIDKNGWVKRLEPNCRAEQIFLTNSKAEDVPPGEFVMLYEGKGQIAVNNVKTVSSEAGRTVFIPQGQFFLSLTQTDPDNPIRNIRVLLPGFEKTYKEQIFRPGFLERWKGFNTIRFMDWMETNNSPVKTWSDYPKIEDMRWDRVPVEIMVDLCNRLGANPWFCMPHQADDDFSRQFARAVKAKLDPKLKVYIEYSNEVWNGMFEQSRWCQKKAVESGKWPELKDRPWEANIKLFSIRSREIFRIWRQELGKDRVVGTIAWQAASGAHWLDGLLLGWDETAKEADALAIAPYMTMCVPAKAGNDGLSADSVAGWSVEQVLDHVEKEALPKCIGWMQEAGKIAEKYKIKLVAYEGGQHLVGVRGGENNQKMTDLFIAANRNERMGGFYLKYLDAWKAAGGDLFCVFSSCGVSNKWGSWGIMERWNDSPEKACKLKAVLDWNAANRRSR